MAEDASGEKPGRLPLSGGKPTLLELVAERGAAGLAEENSWGTKEGGPGLVEAVNEIGAVLTPSPSRFRAKGLPPRSGGAGAGAACRTKEGTTVGPSGCPAVGRLYVPGTFVATAAPAVCASPSFNPLSCSPASGDDHAASSSTGMSLREREALAARSYEPRKAGANSRLPNRLRDPQLPNQHARRLCIRRPQARPARAHLKYLTQPPRVQ